MDNWVYWVFRLIGAWVFLKLVNFVVQDIGERRSRDSKEETKKAEDEKGG